MHTPRLSGTSCSDGQFCNGSETCNAVGGCEPGPADNCQDGIDCTFDGCDEANDLCTNVPTNERCDDGQFCNGAETCTNDGCQLGTIPNCSDGFDCTVDDCGAEANECTHVADSAACNDDNACTEDICRPGTGGPGTGCVYANNNAPCTDNDGCTTEDACDGGACISGPPTVCDDDGLFCTLDTCDPATGACGHAPNPCGDGDGCTVDTCDETEKACGHTYACAHVCNPGPITIPDSGTATPYPSTIIVSGVSGIFSLVSVQLLGLNHTYPDDIDILFEGPAGQNAIIMSDVGDGTGISGVNLTLTDGAPSMPDGGPLVSGTFAPTNVEPGSGTESWPPTAPVPSGLTALFQFDGTNPNGNWNLFVVDDEGGDVGTFAGGWCLNYRTTCKTAADCDDGNACTNDDCHPVLGCVHANNTDPCSDGNACTVDDTCRGGACSGGPPLTCDDGDACTDDDCHPVLGCVHENNTAACSDGNACTTGDTCAGGACVGGRPLGGDTTCFQPGYCNRASICLNGEVTPCQSDPPADVTLSMPDDANGAPMSMVMVPIAVDPADGLSSFQVEVLFDPSVILATGASLTPATTGFSLDFNSPTPGRLLVSLYGEFPLVGTGRQEFARVTFQVVGDAGDTTPLHFVSGITDDYVSTCLDDGLFTVCNDADGDGYTECGGDCDDANRDVYPGAFETCDAVDNNCNGALNDAQADASCSDQSQTACDNRDTCDSNGNCLPNHEPNGTPCTDGNECTTADRCMSGACTGGPQLQCDDENACTEDFCNSSTGCVHDAFCRLSGHIFYYRDHTTQIEPSTKPVDGETVDYQSTLAPMMQSDATDFTGLFEFNAAAGNVTLTPDSRFIDQAECDDAITASDAAEIAKYTVELIGLTPNQQTAAEVSNNGEITAFDASLVAIKAVAIVCNNSPFPVEIANGSNWAWAPPNRNYIPLPGFVSDADFLGIVFGDVTGSWGMPVMFSAARGQFREAAPKETSFPTATMEMAVATRSTEAVLSLSRGVRKNATGQWEVVLGLQNADGILGLDLRLSYDPDVVAIKSVRTTGIATPLQLVSNQKDDTLRMTLYGAAPLQGSGDFLVVTLEAKGPFNGVPFVVSASANEGRIPLTVAPGGPSKGPRPRPRPVLGK